jgi:hypothetical protein
MGSAHQGKPPEPGCYEERYRLNWAAAVIIALGLLAIALAVFVPGIGIFGRVVAIALGGYCVLPQTVVLARRKIAFRADRAGVTLGPAMFPSPSLSLADEFIPWADIKEISLYKVRFPSRYPPAGKYIAIRPSSRAPGAAASRMMGNWRLDRERLAAVIALAAPRVSLADTR